MTEPEVPAAANPVPWEDAGQSRLKGLFRTLKGVLCHPREFFKSLPPGGWAAALAFALIVGTTGFLASLYWQLVLPPGGDGSLGAAPPRCLFARREWAIIPLMLVSPAIILANLTLSSLALWGAARVVGGWRQGLAAVWRLNCYAHGGLVAGFLPLVGPPVAGLWTLFLIYRGMEGVLGLSSGRALGVLGLSLGLQLLVLLLLLGGLAGFRFLG